MESGQLMDSSPPQEMRHQTLQRTLAERSRGGPHEQTMSPAKRLQGTRSCEITHSSLQEPLTHWKSLESLNPRWPTEWRRFHLNHGIRVVDNDTVVISARDQVQKTANGLRRTSSGSVTYSHTQKQKAELEVQEIAHIIGDPAPGGAHAWTPKKVQKLFKERTGRVGVWKHYDIGLTPFLLCFPKTFEMYGANHEYIRLRRAGNTNVLDSAEDFMARLARARMHGFVQQHPTVPGQVTSSTNPATELGKDGRITQKEVSPKLQLPTLRTNRLKTTFKLYESAGSF